MPPKTEDMPLLTLVHSSGDDDSNSNSSLPMTTLPCAASSTTTLSASSSFESGTTLKRQDSLYYLSFLELQQQRQQPPLTGSTSEMNGNDDAAAAAFETSLGHLSLRVEELIARTRQAFQSLENPDDLPVLQACTMSLHTRVPLLLKQATLLIQQLNQHSSNSLVNGEEVAAALIIGRLRSNFALVRLVQYLDLMESAMENPPRELLDQRLLQILQSMNHHHVDISDHDKTFFRVSPWLAKSLAFDLPMGQTACTQLAGSFPLQVEVEPIFEIHAADIVAGRCEHERFGSRTCSVTIQSCKHKATPFSAGAGMIGECILRVHLTPRQGGNQVRVSSSSLEPAETAKLVIQEARAVQVNAYPPKPKANVDLYTSHLHGDAGITATMIIKTSVTETAVEIPKLHIELFLTPPLAK